MRALQSSFIRRFGSQSGNTKKTVLNEFHRSKGGKMVEFAGYDMPVVYNDMGFIESTKYTRTNASLFDVSHMGQIFFKGKNRINFLEWLVVSSIESLKENQCKYTLMCNENGGVIDDLIVNNRLARNCHHMVINASRIDVDLANIRKKMEEFKHENKNKSDVTLEVIQDHSLIAVQGPKAHIVMQALGNINFETLKFFYSAECKLSGIPCDISRSGYTGEDGFEIAVHNKYAVSLVEKLLSYNDPTTKQPIIRLAGLGARDSLRLEAGLCLYGNDLLENITPNEANLMWTISKEKKEKGKFIGCDVIRQQIQNGVNRIRIGMVAEKGASPRAHMPIKNEFNETIGEVTSGGFSPCLDLPILLWDMFHPNIQPLIPN